MASKVAPDPPTADTTHEYTGPSARDMIASHTLTTEIIARHNEPCPILGAPELILLNKYVHSPDQRIEILREHDMVDGLEEQGERLGTRAQRVYGSLVGWGMINEYFNQEDVAELRKWFDEGYATERMAKAAT
jgi:hypothetical protein